ncbi:MATE family efflux transporter [Clostridiaceae bacterium 68-1-5]|uniref:Probable multidrug resistance protein NorM n=1 Tax=Suipraeoptans intestinalis TaxID=2606628 RepID=A0A6N7V3L4_9FIRM|nr:MATE family efflux transporter [Suipraeoptans intestinalis]MSR94700.1 MATE family efflux transporter [Suipraeoptans intestinalis]
MKTNTPVKSEQNKMGTMEISPLLISVSLPMMLSMLVQALYNIVDSMFVAQLSEDALTAVSLAFPIQTLMISVSAGLGVGMNALLSRSLGEGNQEKVNRAASNGLFLNLVCCLAFAIFGAFGSRSFFASQTADPRIIQYGTQYLQIITIFSIGIFLQITFERLLQSTGQTFYNMITQGTGAIINIILDPILIFGLLGFPRLGVTGAAIATVFGQFVAFSLSIFFHQKKNREISLRFSGFRPHLPTISVICEVGVPSIVMQAIGSVMVFGMNKILLLYSSTAAAVFGIYFKLQSFIFMPVFGLSNGMIPIVAYNYGAGHVARIKKTISLSYRIAIGIMLIGLAIFQTLPRYLLVHLFHASPHMLQIGVPALRIISLSFTFAGYGIMSGSVYQALGNGFYSLIASFLRQICVILPAAYLLAHFFGLSAVWWSVPIAEIVAVITFTFLNRRIYRKKLDPMGVCTTPT